MTEAQKDEQMVTVNGVAMRISEMYQRYMRAEQAISKKKSLWRILDIYDRGDQWKDANVPPWIPKPVTNYVRYIRTIKRANLATNIPMVHTTPLEDQFAETINKLQKAYEHVWKWEKVPRIVRWTIDRGLLRGTAIAYVYDDRSYVGGVYKPGQQGVNRLYQGKICVKNWKLQDFNIDPDALTIQEAKFIDATETLPLNNIKRNPQFRKYCKKEGTLDQLDALTADQLERETLGVFQRDYTPGDGTANDKDYMATLHAHWERYITEQGKWQLDVTYYLRNTDFYLYRIENVKPSIYPFAAYLDEQEDEQFHGSSTVMDFLENQRIINKTAQTFSIIGTMHQNPQKVVTRSSGINAQEVGMVGTLPGKTWTTNDVDPAKSIHWSTPPEIPKALFDVDNAMKQDIRETTGVNEAYTGESVGSLTTSTGVRSLIDRASVRDRDKMKQIDAFVEDLSYLIMQVILYKWQDERPIPTRNSDGTVNADTYTPVAADIADQLEWMCECDTYAIAPATQEGRKNDAKELLDIQGKYGFSPALLTPQEFIKMGNYSDNEKILKRMKADLELQAKQQKEAPPKIVPNGDIAFNISSKDPQVIFDTIQQMLQNQQVTTQNNLELTAQHLGNGLATNPQQQQQQGVGAPQAQQGGAPSGSADPTAMAAMTAGGIG